MKLHIKPTELSHDPLAVFEQLAAGNDYCFLLETLADKYQPQTSSQSYIGVAPEHIFAAKEDIFYIDGEEQKNTNPYSSLRRQITFDNSLPAGFIGGLVGYFSHEAIHYFEPSLSFPYKRDFYDFEFAKYNDGLLFRPGQAPDYFYTGNDRSDLYHRTEAINRSELKINFLGAAKEVAAYNQMIDKARADIHNGRVFQVVLANKYEYRFEGDLLNLYKELRRINPSPFMFFLKFGNVITMGASPEMLVHTKPNGNIYLEALAGTIHRGETAEDDTRLADKLIHDEKEIAEHSMLVDLARNDAGRICKIGSVEIEALMYVKKLSHVQHICSLVSGKLEPGRNAFDAVSASFPCGTLSGAPKVEAIKMIRELEGYERGTFGGTIGYFSYNGDSMHATNLRSVTAVGSKLLLHSGSGIVYDSEARREYEEISNKKAAMDHAMEPFMTGESS